VSLDRQLLLRRFDEQVRRGLSAEPGFRVEHTSRVVRVIGLWNCVLYAALDADSVDDEIRAQQDYFQRIGGKLEWKVYGHDQPSDLPQRLARAGFKAGGEETLMVFELGDDLPHVALPPDISLRRVANREGLDDVNAVAHLAFGIDFSALNAEFAARLPLGTLCFYVAYSDTDPVAAARLELPPGSDFAGLYGGGTAPAYRHRGIYRCLVAARANEARSRGYRYLNVEAEPSSRPILDRLGFVALTSVRAWEWTPP